MTDRVFVDTNVLVYTRDASEPSKQKEAMVWMPHLWRQKTGRLSFQILSEFYVTVTHKLEPGLDPARAREDVQALLAWRLIPLDSPLMDGAWRIQDRYRLSWWDALVVSAAQASACRYLLTEDLQENQSVGDIKVINPFHHPPESICRLA